MPTLGKDDYLDPAEFETGQPLEETSEIDHGDEVPDVEGH